MPVPAPDMYLSILLNAAILILVGFVGWLLRRAISNQDETMKVGLQKVDRVEAAVSQLQLLIVGDYYPRKEHQVYVEQMAHTIDQLRSNIHSLRDQIQAVTSKMSVLEALHNKEVK